MLRPNGGSKREVAARSGSSEPPANGERSVEGDWGDDDLGDLLQELRVLLPGTQTLTAFLIILPFNASFSEIQHEEKLIYLATFFCSVCSLVLFTAPAAQHRLQRPLRDREGFKTTATRLMIAGLVPLSAAITLSTFLVITRVLGQDWFAWAAAGIVAVLISIIWWLYPIRRHRQKMAS